MLSFNFLRPSRIKYVDEIKILRLLTCKRVANLFQCIFLRVNMYKAVLLQELLCLCSVDLPIEPVIAYILSLALNSQNITFRLCLIKRESLKIYWKLQETMYTYWIVISLYCTYCIVANISDTLGCLLCVTFLFSPYFNVICDP